MADVACREMRRALAALGVRRLTLGIHESAFPPSSADTGYGSAHAAGDAFLRFAIDLGFNALQLGPGGQISQSNPSPYDGTAFARNALRLDLAALARPDAGSLLARDEVDRLVADGAAPDRADPARAHAIIGRAIAVALPRWKRLREHEPDHPVMQAAAAFERISPWLAEDALFEALASRTGTDDPGRWDPAVAALFERTAQASERRRQISLTLAAEVERAVLVQALLDAQSQAFVSMARAHGMTLFGDLQVGWSCRDRFLRPELFASGWHMGAPPSRTNPQGQPWGYPLLDPDQLDDPHSPARHAFVAVVELALRSHDGIRIDHPHGLVCPWIYRSDAPDPQLAVQHGFRAFESPDACDAMLQRWAIARTGDLDHGVAPHADDRVVRLDAGQIARYSRMIDALLAVAAAHGRTSDNVAAEVLSTCPRPLREVLARHGLGRFVVTQKADLTDPADVYRTDRTARADWVMLGNHDTTPIFAVVQAWHRNGSAAARAAYLASRLEPAPEAREALARRLVESPSEMAQASLADLFLADAENVLVYWTDLFGELEPFNRAGIVHPDNWTLRLPSHYRSVYAARVRERRALDVRAAVATALRARGVAGDLSAALDRKE
ncbi:MAG TPA: 4-alpha-glucanotransferase [Candidatus Limnocylindrales bacterium]|nr:4-alpha-glucanotransferase [Candidatus Limnocylindrales bacterium]